MANHGGVDIPWSDAQAGVLQGASGLRHHEVFARRFKAASAHSIFVDGLKIVNRAMIASVKRSRALQQFLSECPRDYFFGDDCGVPIMPTAGAGAGVVQENIQENFQDPVPMEP